MRCLQGSPPARGRADRGGCKRVRRYYRRGEGAGSGRFLGLLVRPVPRGRARSSQAGSRDARPGLGPQGGYGSAASTGGAFSNSIDPELHRFSGRATGLSAGGSRATLRNAPMAGIVRRARALAFRCAKHSVKMRLSAPPNGVFQRWPQSVFAASPLKRIGFIRVYRAGRSMAKRTTQGKTRSRRSWTNTRKAHSNREAAAKSQTANKLSPSR